MRTAPVPTGFLPDDFTVVQSEFFGELRANEQVDADPSGWLHLEPDARHLAILPQLSTDDLKRYYVDEGPGFIGGYKAKLAALISAWEGRPIDLEEFTVCPSGTAASLVVLATLKALGATRIVFETPTYYAAIEQANLLELTYDLIPTFRSEEYELSRLRDVWSRTAERSVLWLTQPRFGLGSDQTEAELLGVFDLVSSHSFVVIDEVMDQTFPARLGSVAHWDYGAELIRIRSFLKPMGLTGVRLATLLHAPHLRKPIVNALEMMGGAVDVHSLEMVAALAGDVGRFRSMLTAANRQAISLRERAERLTRGSFLRVNRLTNGYVGSAVADLAGFGRTQEERRRNFLAGCQRVRTPVVLGASFYMAVDPPTEAIRLSYLNSPSNVLRGLANLLSLA